MSLKDDAVELESLLPRSIGALFASNEPDPLRHHSVGQIRLMRMLSTGSKSASEISQALGLSPSSLTQMASRMMAAGLITKQLDSQDRRVRVLSLTDAGRQMMEQRRETRSRAAERVLAEMDPHKRAALMDILREVCAMTHEESALPAEATA